ncbi:MAG: pyruvate, phosphate dikinase, partial [Holophagae bacterium]|nr:pyruvate, phosphate dikinase [Holophagae bacterium]
MKKSVYYFSKQGAEGNTGMKNLLGGKGSNLAEMCNLGVPVPPGFTLSTEACVHYYKNDGKYPEGLEEQVLENLARLEKELGKSFGDTKNPMLVSVRSGARVSMPGMMDTVLNLGLNDQSVLGLVAESGNERFAYDSYRRFIQMFGNVVMGVDSEHFESRLTAMKKDRGVKEDTELSAADLRELVDQFKSVFQDKTGEGFPQEPIKQLWNAIGAVFGSWNNDRANTYRRINHIPNDWGTAVNVQSMVFGNMGDSCATGVAFTRDPATGAKRFFGEFLINAQGEDVVAGTRTPHPISIEQAGDSGLKSLEEEMPEMYLELVEIYKKLETHYRDMQDLEFTIENGKLYLLQTRNGKRTGFAGIRIAVDLVEEGLLTEEEGLHRVEPNAITQLLAPVFNMDNKKIALAAGRFLAKGLNAGPGAASGRIALSAEKAIEMAGSGKVVLVRFETSPEDLAGMDVAQGILTARGGMTSHAAVVARGMGKPCVVGCGDLDIDYDKGTVTAGGRILKEGDNMSIDGSTGEVLEGIVETMPSEVIQILVEGKGEASQSIIYRNFTKLIGWAEKAKRLGVRTNADTPHDAAIARSLGAKGIGLCRTEHMFFDEDRILAVREMIVAKSTTEREKALAKILPMQREDFEGIFTAMNNLPVTVRLLDP